MQRSEIGITFLLQTNEGDVKGTSKKKKLILIQTSFFYVIGAKNGTRTRDPQLGKLMLYQLSYFRVYVWSHKSTKSLKKKGEQVEKTSWKV